MFEGLVNGITGIFNTMLNYDSQSNAAADQFIYNKRMADLQNQYNLNMWNLNNAYNTPKAQMERLKDAGLNPNLLYNSVSTGNSSSGPEQVAPAPQKAIAPVFNLGTGINLINDLFELRKKRAELKQMEAVTEATEKKGMSYEQDIMNKYSFQDALRKAMNLHYFGIPLQVDGDSYDANAGWARYLAEKYKNELDIQAAHYKNLGEQFNYIKSHKDYIKEQKSLLEKKAADYRVDKLLERIGLGVDWFVRGVGAFKGFGLGSPSPYNGPINNYRYYGNYYNY